MITEHFQLMQQYNQISLPISWKKFFKVIQMKKYFRVAVIYTPDEFIKAISIKDFRDIERRKRISKYAFSDSSFVNLIQELEEKNYNLISILWEQTAEKSIDTIDLSEINNLDTLKENLKEIEDSLFIVDQAIQKVTLQNRLREQFTVTRYGEVITSTISDYGLDSTRSFLEIIL